MKSVFPLKIFISIFALQFGLLFAGDGNGSDIHWGFLVMGLFGGLSLFLYGMDKMSDGLKKVAGNQMRNILATLTQNRVIALIVGAFVTMVIQSSSATTVMLVSFVQAQLMTYAQSIGIILGANIGTTVTAQLIAFKLTDYALLMITAGFVMTLFGKKDSIKHTGEVLLGFGILFFGMKLMSDSMKPLRTFEPFIGLMRGLENPFYGILIGAGFTALIQSSSAFTGIVIVLAQQGLLTLDAGIPLILGANIGTCITAALARIVTIREAKRVALAHILINTSGVLLFIWFIPDLSAIVKSLSSSSGLTGLDKLAAETPRQIANAHTIFNVGVGLIFLPFTKVLEKLVYRFLPKIKKTKGIEPTIWHLDDSQIGHPAVAIELARTEMLRMIKILTRMVSASIVPFSINGTNEDEVYPELSIIDGIQMRENKIDFLERNVSDYSFKISRQELTNTQAIEVFAMMSIIKDMESVGDIIDKNIIPLAGKFQNIHENFSEEGESELNDFHIRVMKQLSRLKEAFGEMRLKTAEKIITKDLKYRNLETEYRITHLKRVQQALTESVATHEVHMELMDLLKQINVYLANIAKTIISMDLPD